MVVAGQKRREAAYYQHVLMGGLIVHGRGTAGNEEEGAGGRQKAVSLFLGPTITKAQRSAGSKERWRGANELIRTSSALLDQYRLV